MLQTGTSSGGEANATSDRFETGSISSESTSSAPASSIDTIPGDSRTTSTQTSLALSERLSDEFLESYFIVIPPGTQSEDEYEVGLRMRLQNGNFTYLVLNFELVQGRSGRQALDYRRLGFFDLLEDHGGAYVVPTRYIMRQVNETAVNRPNSHQTNHANEEAQISSSAAREKDVDHAPSFVFDEEAFKASIRARSFEERSFFTRPDFEESLKFFTSVLVMSILLFFAPFGKTDIAKFTVWSLEFWYTHGLMTMLSKAIAHIGLMRLISGICEIGFLNLEYKRARKQKEERDRLAKTQDSPVEGIERVIRLNSVPDETANDFISSLRKIYENKSVSDAMKETMSELQWILKTREIHWSSADRGELGLHEVLAEWFHQRLRTEDGYESNELKYAMMNFLSSTKRSGAAKSQIPFDIRFYHAKIKICQSFFLMLITSGHLRRTTDWFTLQNLAITLFNILFYYVFYKSASRFRQLYLEIEEALYYAT